MREQPLGILIGVRKSKPKKEKEKKGGGGQAKV